MGAFFWPKHERTHWAKSSKIFLILYSARSLKITEKVSFSIASEASYGYILSGQKLLKNGPIFENLKIAVKQCYQAGQF